MLRNVTRRNGNQRKNWENLVYIIGRIGQNTQQDPGDRRKLAVSQTPIKTTGHHWCKKLAKRITIIIIIIIVIGAFGTVTKGLLKGLEDLEVGGRVETIQTTALLKTARILRRVLETWGDLLSLRLQWKTIG